MTEGRGREVAKRIKVEVIAGLDIMFLFVNSLH